MIEIYLLEHEHILYCNCIGAFRAESWYVFLAMTIADERVIDDC